MHDFPAVQKLHRLTNLLHKARARSLRQHKVFVDDSLEQFAALNPAKKESTVDGDNSYREIPFLQFHKAIKFISKVERIVNLNDRRMIEARHYINFHLHHRLFFLLLIANDLHSELLTGCLLLA